jgi:hypothetical protein
MPLQHCASEPQESLFCVQNEPLLEQRPPLQNFEQHSKFCVHVLPAVRQVLSGVHLLAAQVPPQHSAFVVHAWLSLMHWVVPQVPPLHTEVQQSCGPAHALPPVRQGPVD